MPINTIDNFSINVSKPIDTRMVVANSVARNAISFLYDGLKVFQQDDRKTYTWNTGSLSWTNDNDNLNEGYVPKSNGIGLGLTNSNIYSTASNVSINTYILTPSLSTMEVFQLNNPNGSGVGYAEPLTFHSLSESVIGYNWYYNGSEQRFNSTKGSSAIRFNDNGVILFSPFAGAPNVFGSSIVRLDPSTGVEIDSPLLLNDSSSYLSFQTNNATKIYSPGINMLSFETNSVEVFRLSDDRIRLADGTSVNPILSFSSSTGTGIYSPSLNSLGISVNGWSAAFMSQIDVSLAVAGATGLSLTSADSNLSFGGNTVSVTSTWISLKISGSIPSYQSGFTEKIIVEANDVLANIHQQGTDGIGDSGNYTYAPDGLGGGTGPWQFPSIASGLFTLATVADASNVTGAAPSGYTTWMRVGNVVNVSGQIAFNVTVANTGSSFTVTLPIKSFLGANNYWQLNGTGKILNTAAGLNVGGGDVACIQASIVGDRAQFNFRPTSTGAKTMMYHYQYVVATYINSPAPPGPPPAP